MRTRRASVLTKKPISDSSSARWRFATAGADHHLVLAGQPRQQQ
jgi:hypothetical protein